MTTSSRCWSVGHRAILRCVAACGAAARCRPDRVAVPVKHTCMPGTSRTAGLRPQSVDGSIDHVPRNAGDGHSVSQADRRGCVSEIDRHGLSLARSVTTGAPGGTGAGVSDATAPLGPTALAAIPWRAAIDSIVTGHLRTRSSPCRARRCRSLPRGCPAEARRARSARSPASGRRRPHRPWLTPRSCASRHRTA